MISERPQHQRHAAVLARALRRGHRGLPVRARGGRGRPVGHLVGGVVLRQPGRHRGRPPARRDRHRRGRWPCKGKAAVANAKLAYELFLERFSGPRWEALAARGARSAAAAVGVHVHQEPGLPRHALRRRAHRARHGQHHARRHARRVRRPRHRRPHRRRRRRRGPGRARRAGRGRASTSPTSPRCSRTKAWPPSASRSTSCSASLQAKADGFGA